MEAGTKLLSLTIVFKTIIIIIKIIITIMIKKYWELMIVLKDSGYVST